MGSESLGWLGRRHITPRLTLGLSLSLVQRSGPVTAEVRGSSPRRPAISSPASMLRPLKSLFASPPKAPYDRQPGRWRTRGMVTRRATVGLGLKEKMVMVPRRLLAVASLAALAAALAVAAGPGSAAAQSSV